VSAHMHEVPAKFLSKWQGTTNVMADIFDVPAGLIMRVLPKQIEVLISSHTPKNPYEADEKANLHTGLYCETVMATRNLLHVPNALQDSHWKDNPDVKLNMISYLGVPLIWPDGEVFGTICVLDSKTRIYQDKYVDLLWEIKKSIEADFTIIEQQANLLASYAEVLRAVEKQEKDAEKLRLTNEELSKALSSLTKMQAQLVRSEKISALGFLVAGISHELNTPIGNCLLAASTLQCRTTEMTDEISKGISRRRIEEFVQQFGEGSEILMRGLTHAANLVSSFKQVGFDQTSLNRRHFSLKDTVSDILMTLSPSIKERNVVIKLDIPTDINIDSYPGPLWLILSNLIDNALLHGFAGRSQGEVGIYAELEANREVVNLIVRDDGVGISPANLPRVFDPFFTTTLGQGRSGLGLHIAYNHVTTVLGGTIEVESVLKEGTSFKLAFPRVAPLAAVDTAAVNQ